MLQGHTAGAKLLRVYQPFQGKSSSSEKSATYEELLEKAKLTTLYNRRLQDIAIMMYKVKYKVLPSYVVDIFEENEARYQLLNENDFKVPRFQSVRYGKHS